MKTMKLLNHTLFLFINTVYLLLHILQSVIFACRCAVQGSQLIMLVINRPGVAGAVLQTAS